MTLPETLSPAQRRTVLAGAAALTPGLFYHGSDLADSVPEPARFLARRALIALADRALDDLPEGQTLTCRFGGLSFQDAPQGDWTVEVSHAPRAAPLLAPAPLLPLPPAEEIRAWISAASETTPETVYLTSPVLEDMEPKVLADGAVLGPLQIAAMTLASSCAVHGVGTADLRIQVVRCLPALRTGRFDVRVRRAPAGG